MPSNIVEIFKIATSKSDFKRGDVDLAAVHTESELEKSMLLFQVYARCSDRAVFKTVKKVAHSQSDQPVRSLPLT